MSKTSTAVGALALVLAGIVGAPAVIQAHESDTAGKGMMMQPGDMGMGMMQKMSRMMDRCEAMMDKSVGAEKPAMPQQRDRQPADDRSGG